MSNKMSLRWRLLGAFLLAAFLTMLCGGGGILSLHRIRSDMATSSAEVSTTVS